MALYQGEDLLDVTTPDGRTLKLPRSLVPSAMMPQQIGAPGPLGPTEYTPELPGPGPEAPSVTGGQLPIPDMQQRPPAAPVAQPDLPPVVIDLPSAEEGNKAYAQKQAQQAAYRASPHGQLASAQAEANAADADVAAAVQHEADVQGAAQAEIGRAQADRNKTLDGLFAQRAADMQNAAVAEEAKMREVESLGKKIANTKIDRSLDHPILVAIGAALAGLGAGMKGEKVETGDMIYRAIDRKVAAQEADLDRMGKIYGMTKDELAMLKDRSKNRLEFHNTMVAGEMEKAARHIEEITSRTANEQTKARAQSEIARLRVAAAEKRMEATRWGIEYDQKEKHQQQQIALGYAGIANQRYSTDLGAQIDRERIAADLQKALLAEKAAGNTAGMKARLEADKEAREVGLKGVDNGYLLTPEGKQKMEAAAKLEADANALTNNPAAADTMRQKAAIIRSDANTYDVVKGRSAPDAAAMSKKYAAAQAMLDVIDNINIIYDKAGRQLIGRDAAQQELQSLYKLLNVKGKDAWQLGAWDKGSATLSADIFGSDPSAWAGKTLLYAASGGKMGDDPRGFMKRLDAVAEDVQNSVTLEVAKNSTWDGKGDLFTRKRVPEVSKEATKLSQARSGTELTKNAADVGLVGKAVRGTFWSGAPSHAEEAENAQSLRQPGLSYDQEAPFEKLLQRHKAGDQHATTELVDTVVSAAQSRPDFALPLMHNLRTEAPGVYAVAKAALPKDSKVGEQLTYEDSNRIDASLTPGGARILGQQVLESIKPDGTVGDQEGLKELGRLASKKDPDAMKALAEIFTRKAAR